MTFSDSEINIIQNIITKELSSKNRIVSEDVWKALGPDKAEKGAFKSALSQALKDGKFPGFVAVRGRYGGIRKFKDEPKPAVKSPVSVKIVELNKKISKDVVQKALSKVHEPILLEKEKNQKDNYNPDMDRAVPYPDRQNSQRNKWEEMIVDGKCFIHTMNLYQFRDLMKQVFQIEESKEEGNVSAFGKNFQCNKEQLRMLDALLLYCFGAKYRI